MSLFLELISRILRRAPWAIPFMMLWDVAACIGVPFTAAYLPFDRWITYLFYVGIS